MILGIVAGKIGGGIGLSYAIEKSPLSFAMATECLSPLIVILRRKPKDPKALWISIPVDPQGFGILHLRFATVQDDK